MAELDFITFMKDVDTSLRVANKQGSPQNIFCTKRYSQDTSRWSCRISILGIWAELALCCVPYFVSITVKLEFYINIKVVGIRVSFPNHIYSLQTKF